MILKRFEKKYALKTIALLVPILFLFSGCGNASKTTKNNKEFIYGIQTEPDNLDPYKASTADSRKMLFNIFEGLVKVNKNGEFIPAVAESYTVSKDGLTYSFKIRDNLKFHNGKTVTCDDVKYSIDKAISSKIKGFDSVDSVNIKDDNTIDICIKKANADFIAYLTTAIVPKDYNNQSE